MAVMRAKVRCASVTPHMGTVGTRAEGEKFGEVLEFVAVGKSGPYPDDGADDDNTYAKYSPTASFKIDVRNPAIFGKFTIGQKFYVDFTEAP